MTLDDPGIDKLTELISDSFRVRPNHDPVYVDIGGHLNRLAAKQHQVIFGRRGSGKSCLLVHFHRAARQGKDILTVYIEADEVKTLPYPDLLIRLLLTIGDALRSATKSRLQRLLWWRSDNLDMELAALRALLDQAEVAEVSSETRQDSSTSIGTRLDAPGAAIDASMSEGSGQRTVSDFTEKKIETLERHLQDYKKVLNDTLENARIGHVAVIVDDFYLIPKRWQPEAIDYLHRLLRGTDLYLKLGTVRHRTRLVRYDDGQTIGVESGQDIEQLDLDHTFEDIDSTKGYLATMLDSMGAKVGLPSVSDTYLSKDGLLHLTLASGGVPRDFLTVFVEAVKAARESDKLKWLTRSTVYKGAARVSYQTKLKNLRDDVGAEATNLEAVYQDLTNFCLSEAKKTAFLVAQEEVQRFGAEHELIQQLMDFKLIHVIVPDTSAASGRSGRYEAYALDFALFMEPRLRNIEHVEFWRVDQESRRQGLREAPVYSLARVNNVLRSGTVLATTESTIETIQANIGFDDSYADGSDDG